MKRTTPSLLPGMVFAVFFNCLGCQSNSPEVNDNGDADLTAVKVINLKETQRGLRRTTTQPATVNAYHQADIYAKVSGYLVELKADIGKKVEKGEILGVIDVPELEKAKLRQLASIEQSVANELRARAEVDLAKAALDAAVATVQQADANVKNAEAQLKSEISQFKRTSDLVARGTLENRLLDEARRKLESIQAMKESSLAGVTAEKAKLAVAKAQLAAAAAEKSVADKQTNVARKKLDEMNALMAFAEIRAPFGGVVIARNVDKGDLVRNMQNSSDKPRKPLFSVAQVDKLRARIAVPENDAPFAKVGKLVEVKFRSMPQKSYSAKISRTSASLDPSTRTMIAEVDLDNNGKLCPGMYGEATIILENRPNAIVLPAAAVRHDEKGNASVYVVQPDNSIRIVAVVTGADDGKTIEIVSGLEGSEQVAGSIIGRLQSNQKVRIIK